MTVTVSYFLLPSTPPNPNAIYRTFIIMCIVFFQAFSTPATVGVSTERTATSTEIAASATETTAAGSQDVHAAIARSYKLILASNRDEFLVRPTRRPRFWDDTDGVNNTSTKNEEKKGVMVAQMEKPHVDARTNSNTTTALSSSFSPFSRVWAGKDLLAGGTWMGITRTGRFGVLTNVRTPTEDLLAAAAAKVTATATAPTTKATKLSETRAVSSIPVQQGKEEEKDKAKETNFGRKSRGHLVLDFLADPDPNLLPMTYAQSLASLAGKEGGSRTPAALKACEFAGYNLLVGNVGRSAQEGGEEEEVEMAYYSNCLLPGQAQKLEDNRLYAISNRLLDVPWAKVQRGKRLFTECLTEGALAAAAVEKGGEGREDEDEVLAHLLLDRLLHDNEPCSPATDTGYPLEFEKKLAQICIPGVALRGEEEEGKEGKDGGEKGRERSSSVFGTTASIVVLVRRDGRMLFYERGLEWDEARETHVGVWSSVRRTEVKLAS